MGKKWRFNGTKSDAVNVKLLLLIVSKCNSMCPQILSLFETAINTRKRIKTINLDSKVPLTKEGKTKMFFQETEEYAWSKRQLRQQQ